MAKIRTFIAVELPQDTRMAVDRLTSAFRGEGKDIRWVNAQNLHITLRFLGDIDEAAVPGLAESIRSNLDGFGRFQISLSGLGVFPNFRRPRVIWVGTGSGVNRLGDLAALVEKACIASEFGRADKPFNSHITIGRVKFPKGIDNILRKVEAASFENGPFEVGKVVIFKSDLSPAGPKYTPLEVIEL
jgi:2'-5' RNA ligase